MNNRAGAVKVGEGLYSFVHDGLTTSTTRYYWVRGVDDSGNLGAYHPTSATAGVSATPVQVEGADVASRALGSSKLIPTLRNLAENGDFEAGSVVWTALGSRWTVENDPANARTGSYVLKQVPGAGSGSTTTSPASESRSSFAARTTRPSSAPRRHPLPSGAGWVRTRRLRPSRRRRPTRRPRPRQPGSGQRRADNRREPVEQRCGVRATSP